MTGCAGRWIVWPGSAIMSFAHRTPHVVAHGVVTRVALHTNSCNLLRTAYSSTVLSCVFCIDTVEVPYSCTIPYSAPWPLRSCRVLYSYRHTVQQYVRLCALHQKWLTAELVASGSGSVTRRGSAPLERGPDGSSEYMLHGHTIRLGREVHVQYGLWLPNCCVPVRESRNESEDPALLSRDRVPTCLGTPVTHPVVAGGTAVTPALASAQQAARPSPSGARRTARTRVRGARANAQRATGWARQRSSFATASRPA